MAMNTNVTASSGLSDGMKTYYFRRMLQFVKPKLVHAQFAEKKTAPKKSGKVVEFRRWVPMPTITTPLTEAVIPDGQQLVEEAITAQVYQYGGYVAISDMLTLTHADVRVKDNVELMGDQGGRSVDEVVRDVMASTTNVQYANSKTAIYNLLPTDEFNTTELRKAVRTLEEQNTPYFRKGGDEHFVSIIDQHTKYDIQSDKLWQDVSKYSDKEQIYSGEIGRLFGVRFVRTTLAKKYENSDLKPGQTYLTVNGANTGAEVPIKEELTSTQAAALANRYVAVYDASAGTYERIKISSATAGAAGAAKVTLVSAPSEATVADDMLYANEYGQNGNTVRATMIFGKKSYAMIDIGGKSKNIRSIIKGRGEIGGPLEQYSTVGWKVEAMACTILQPLWLVKVLHGATA